MYLFDLLFGRTRQYRVCYTERHPGANVFQSVTLKARNAYEAARQFDTNYTEYQRRSVEEI